MVINKWKRKEGLRILDKQFTIIPNEYVCEAEMLPSNELVILIMLLMRNTNKGICIFNLKEILNELNISVTDSSRITKTIDTLETLRQKNIINYYSDIILTQKLDKTEFKKANLIYGSLDIPITNDNFTMIYDEEFMKILQHCKGKKINKHVLIHTFLCIIKYINNNEKDEEYKLAKPSFDRIGDMMAINDKTIIKYLKIFKELNLLEYNYVGARVMASGNIKNTNMYYCRKEDEDILKEYIGKELKNNNYININKDNKNKSNLKRSLKQKINKLEKTNRSKTDGILLEELKDKYEELNK
jgi:uncharacterized protein YbgA (DUF1722 family)